MTTNYLSPVQVMDLYPTITPRLLAQWRWTKMGPPFTKVGKTILYDRDDIETFFVEHKVAPSLRGGARD